MRTKTKPTLVALVDLLLTSTSDDMVQSSGLSIGLEQKRNRAASNTSVVRMGY